MIRVSTHVLDTARGCPAAGVAVMLEAAGPGGTWAEVGRGVTDADGRSHDLAPAGVAPGDYRLRFATGDYHGDTAFYPEVVVCVRLGGASKYHLPLLLSPFGYSTYRGS
jgi:5-hydroxyisourate hydrolase